MSRKRQPLTRDRVLDAAITLVDEQGLAALSMRRLAQSLGVEAMSLYNHVANKEDLTDAIVERVLAEFELPADVKDWREAIRRCALSAYDAFRRHPWAVELAVSPRSSTIPEARVTYMEFVLRRLHDAGFSDELTYSGYHAIDSHIFGFTLWQSHHTPPPGVDLRAAAEQFFAERGGECPHLVAHAQQHFAKGPDGREEFEFKLDLVLDALARLKRTRI
jgi:AcrR family transcriptional regulator